MTTFSLYQVLATVFGTFLLSVIGGALFQRYLARPKPSIKPTAVRFWGDRIQLSERAVEASENDMWGENLSAITSYEKAIQRDLVNSERILEFKYVKEQTEKWLRKFDRVAQDTCITANQVRQTPYFNYPHIGSSIVGELKRRSLPDPPTDEEIVLNLPAIFELSKDDDRIALHAGDRRVGFPLHNLYSERETQQQELIARSFATGCLSNIIFVHQHFLSKLSDEIERIRDLQIPLRESLLESAFFCVDAVVTNVGDRPIIFEPYFVAKATLGDEKVNFIMREAGDKKIAEPDGGAFESLLKEVTSNEQRSVMFEAESLLPDTRGARYVSIASGGTIELSLIAIEPMKSSGKKIHGQFELGTLNLSISGRTEGGYLHSSQNIVFGRALTDQQRKELLRQHRVRSR